ncbi:MAG: hypothetical protein AB7P20_10725 [Rhizobiaceae bacterium]
MLLPVIMPLLAGCGGMVRAVKVLPDTADQLCQQTRQPDQREDCVAGRSG